MYLKVKFYSFWVGEDILYQQCLNWTKGGIGIYNNLEVTDNVDNADIIVVLEGFPNNFNFDLVHYKQIICLPQEPLIHPIKNYERCKFVKSFTYNNIHHPITRPNFIDKSYDELVDLKFNICSEKLSIVMSRKNFGHTYQNRINFLIDFIRNYPEFKVYGYGWFNELGNSYAGPLANYHQYNDVSEKTKFDVLYNSKYSLCIENCRKNNYFTEKFTDAILSWTIPIYWGCPNIDDYFPSDCFRVIDINHPDVNEHIINIINQPITPREVQALDIARNLILNEYHIMNMVRKILL